MTGVELIAKERAEQVNKHGYTIQKDVDQNSDGQLSQAALVVLDEGSFYCPDNWNPDVLKKMCSKDYKSRLVIAGALIAAELDRLIAIESQQQP